jgi:hypothetical protein
MNVNQIYEGWRNHLFPPDKLKQLILDVSEERMLVCDVCKYNSANAKTKSIRPDVHCLQCGCTLLAKTKCLSCECPKKFWLAVLTEEEEREIINTKGYEKD